MGSLDVGPKQGDRKERFKTLAVSRARQLADTGYEPRAALRMAMSEILAYQDNNERGIGDFLSGKQRDIGRVDFEKPRLLSNEEWQSVHGTKYEPGVINTIKIGVHKAASAFVQEFADLGVGTANLLGAGLHSPDVSSYTKAMHRKVFGGADGRSLSEVAREEQTETLAADKNADFVQKIVGSGAEMLGKVTAMVAPVTLAKGGKLITPFGLGMRMGDAVAKRTALSKSPVLLQKMVQNSIAFGSHELAVGRNGEGEAGQGSPWERAQDAAIGAAVGSAAELFGWVGRGLAARAMLRGDSKVLDAIGRYGRNKGYTKLSGETVSQGARRIASDWVADGMPGAGITARRLVAESFRLGSESLGFSAIDTEFRSKFYEAVFHGDADAAVDAAATMLGTAFGIGLLHTAGRLKDIPRWQRQQPNGPWGEASGTPAFPTKEKPGEFQLKPPIGPERQLPEQSVGEDQRRAEASARSWDQAGRRIDAQERFVDTAKPQEPHPVEAKAAADQRIADWETFVGDRLGRDAGDVIRLGWRPEEMGAEESAMEGEGGAQTREPPKRIRMTLPGTGLVYSISGDTATPGGKLARALGIEEKPIKTQEFHRRLEIAQLASVLTAKATLSGHEIDVRGVYAMPGAGAVPGTLRTVAFGQVLEKPLADPTAPWSPNLTSIPPRRPDDAISQQQQSVIRHLNGVRKLRLDLWPEYDALADALIGTLQRVAAESDQSVKQAVDAYPQFARAISTGSRVEAGNALVQFAHAMTTKEPGLAMADWQRSMQTEAERMAAAQHPREVPPESAGEARRTGDQEKRPDDEPPEPEPGSQPTDEPRGPLPQNPVMYGGIPFGPEIKGAFFGLTGGLKSLAGRALDWYSATSVSRVARAGAKEFAEKGRRALGEARKIMASAGNKLASFQKRVRSFDPVFDDRISRDVAGHKIQYSRWAAYKDDRIGEHLGVTRSELDAEHQKTLEIADDLTTEIRKLAAAEGVQIAAGPLKGEVVSEEARRNVMTFSPTSELRDARTTGKGPVYDALRDVLAELHDMTPNEVDQKWSEGRTLVGRDPIELVRQFPLMPGSIEVNGRMVRLLNDEPGQQIGSMVNHAAGRLGVIRVFGQDTPTASDAEMPYREQLSEVLRQHGQPAVDRSVEMLRSLQGIPTNPIKIDPADPAYRLGQGLSAIGSLWGAAKMTMSWLPNMLELGGAPSARLGLTRVVGALSEVGKAIVSGEGLQQLVEQAVRDGVFHHEIRSLKGIPDTDMLGRFRSGSRQLSEILLTPFEWTQHGVELVVSLAARAAAKEMQAGNGTNHDIAFARQLGFSHERATAMAKGEGTADEYHDFRSSATSELTGGRGEREAEQSAFARSRIGPKIVRFTNFFQHQTRMLRSAGMQIAEARDITSAATSAVQLMRVMGYNLAAGMSMNLLSGLLQGTSVQKRLKEMMDDPWWAARSAFVSTMFGGPGQFLAEIGSALFRSGPGADEDIGRATRRLFTPVAIFDEGYELVSALSGSPDPFGPYAGKTKTQIAWEGVQQFIPATKLGDRGVFGISAAGIGGDPTIDNAVKRAKSWMFRNVEGGGGGGDGDPEFLAAMRGIENLLRRDVPPSDEQVINLVREAAQHGTDGLQSVSTSLRQRSPLHSQKFGKLKKDQEKLDRFRKVMGDDWGTLVAYDALLNAMADAFK